MTREARSRIMRAIRKTDTGPELAVRRQAHRLGFRFRLHRRDLPGTPDLVFSRHRALVFVHGCFWHQHPGCRLAKLPHSHTDYWLPKLARNAERDREAQAALTGSGWRVLTIWECEVADGAALGKRLMDFLRPGTQD